ncbi:MAG TPA: pilus assembly protein PilM [Kofleriaceae bacterium]|jgi:general secretion pathway protein L
MASRVFAVDLGAWSVKLAIATPGMRGAQLLNVIERLVPPGDTPSEDRAKAVLAELIAEMKLREESGYIGVYGDQVFTQILEFGFKNLRRADLERAVGNDLEGVVPVDLEDMVYTFESIPAPAGEGPVPAQTHGRVAAPHDGMRVLAYAMHKERAEHLIKLGDEAGFHPRGVLACGGAAVRLVERTPSLAQPRTDGAVAVVDIGHERTDVVVVAQGKAVFSRSIARAGKQVTSAVQRQWPHLSWHDAELAKHSDGFVASQTEPAASDAWAKISLALMTELQPFARDIRQTLAACRAKTGWAPVAAILVGGGSRLRGIGSFLSEQIGVPSWRLGQDDIVALAGMRLGAQATQLPVDSAALTVGMAYDAAGGRPMFDLRSGDLAMKMDLGFLRQKAVPLGAALVAIFAFAGISAYADLYRLNKAQKILSARLASDSEEVFHERRTAAQVLSSKRAAGLSASPLPKMSAYDIMLEISKTVPGKDKVTVDITSLEIDDQKVDLGGSGKTSKDIEDLAAELKKIECFKEVSLGNTDTSADGTKTFKITITAQCTEGGT